MTLEQALRAVRGVHGISESLRAGNDAPLLIVIEAAETQIKELRETARYWWEKAREAGDPDAEIEGP